MTGDGRRTGRIRNDRWCRMYSDMEYILFAFRRYFCGRHAAAYRQPAGRGSSRSDESSHIFHSFATI